MKQRVFLTLGSNVDREHHYPLAVAKIARLVGIVAVSPVYETLPVGMEAGAGSFFNGAVLVETDADPDAFKQSLIREIETPLGRRRSGNPKTWISRTIDVDIAIWGDRVGKIRGRRVPDPDIPRYLHLALPLADLAPSLVVPGQEGVSRRTLAVMVSDLLKSEPLPRRRDDIVVKF